VKPAAMPKQKAQPKKKISAAKAPASYACRRRVIPPFSYRRKNKALCYKPFATVSKDWPKKEESLNLCLTAQKEKAPVRFGNWPPRRNQLQPEESYLAKIGRLHLLAILLIGYVLLGIYKYSLMMLSTINFKALCCQLFVNNSTSESGVYR
jgi:hypothetical protein